MYMVTSMSVQLKTPLNFPKSIAHEYCFSVQGVCTVLLGRYCHFFNAAPIPTPNSSIVNCDCCIRPGQPSNRGYVSSSPNTDSLGHDINPGCLVLAYFSWDAVARLEQSTTKTELRSFLGLYNVFRRSAPTLLDSLRPQQDIGKDQPRRVVPQQEKQNASVASLKETLMRPPVLALPETEGQYKLDTDA